MREKKEKREAGGVALEYILVSSFAALATTALLSIMGKVAHKKMDSIKEKFGIEAELNELQEFLD